MLFDCFWRLIFLDFFLAFFVELLLVLIFFLPFFTFITSTYFCLFLFFSFKFFSFSSFHIIFYFHLQAQWPSSSNPLPRFLSRRFSCDFLWFFQIPFNFWIFSNSAWIFKWSIFPSIGEILMGLTVIFWNCKCLST